MLHSLSAPVGEIKLPVFMGDRLYMHPVDISNPLLPAGYERWDSIIKEIIAHAPKQSGTAYITIDEKEVIAGETHRRGGKHIDGNYIHGWGGGGDGAGWLTGENGRMLPRDKHLEQYCSKTGGMLIVSSYPACIGWNGSYNDEPAQGGNCNHIDVSKMDSTMLQANKIYWGNSTFIHESLPLKENVKRTIVRITLPADSPNI